MRKDAGDVVRFAAEFGLTPAARSRISAGIHGDNSQSEFAGLIAGKRTPEGKRRAQAVIKFIEKLTVPSGHGMGKPFKLEAFQWLFIRSIYEPHLGLRRAMRRAILSMARKNGKTALIAAPLKGKLYSSWLT